MLSRINFFGITKAIVLAFTCAVLASTLFQFGYAVAGEPWRGYIGLDLAPKSTGEPGGWLVNSVEAGGAAAEAGVRGGDTLIFDHPNDKIRSKTVDEPIGVTLKRGDQTIHLVIHTNSFRTVSLTSEIRWAFCISPFVSSLSALLALFVLLRCGTSRSLLLLAGAMTLEAQNFDALPLSRGLAGYLVDLLPYFNYACGVGFVTVLVCFVVQFSREANVNLGKWPVRTMYGYVCMYFVAAVGWMVSVFYGQPAPWWSMVYVGLGGPLMFYFALLGRRNATGQTRMRFNMLMFSFVPLLFLTFLVAAHYQWNVVDFAPFVIAINTLIFIFLLILVYVALRHRVLNLGFVLNRSIVFAMISAVLLIGFGLVEWLSEHLIHFESREKYVALDAVVALGIYLLFHRVRHTVEHTVERLFFHHWHVNEEHLRRFVLEAGYIASADKLLQAFCSELTRFSGAASSAVYISNEDGTVYARCSGAGDMHHPDTIDCDDPVLLAMHTQRSRVAVDETRSGLAYADAFPFFHRGRLLGFAILMAKPSGDAYRPDELELLAWAAHQIGLDHQAVTLINLERKSGELAQQMAIRDAELVVLREQTELLRNTIGARFA